MKRKRVLVMGLCSLLVLGSGCGTNKTEKAVTNSGDTQKKEITKESTGRVHTKIHTEPSKLPDIPRNQKEYDEMFGIVDESGTWIPPEGSYRDPKTGKIYNKDGILIGGEDRVITPKPGSKG